MVHLVFRPGAAVEGEGWHSSQDYVRVHTQLPDICTRSTISREANEGGKTGKGEHTGVRMTHGR